jgi:hypothetical protein
MFLHRERSPIQFPEKFFIDISAKEIQHIGRLQNLLLLVGQLSAIPKIGLLREKAATEAKIALANRSHPYGIFQRLPIAGPLLL